MKPEYQDTALSIASPLPKAQEQRFPQLWIYTPLWGPQNCTKNPSVMNDVVADGWIQVPAYSNVVLTSQLYQTALTVQVDSMGTPITGALKTWYKPEEDDPEPAPVILAFSIASNPSPETIPMLNPLPLPQLGEYAYTGLNNSDSLLPYHILQLPLEARQRWVKLGEALKKLASPILWPAFTEHHKIASNEFEYNRQIQALDLQQKLALPGSDTQAQLLMQSVHLMAAHQQIEELGKALEKSSWLQEWKEIQSMARALAQDYYEYHKQQASSIAGAGIQQTPLPIDLPEPETPAQVEKSTKPKRLRVHRTPTSIEAKGKESISVKSDIFTREIIAALRDRDTYTKLPEYNMAEHKHQFYKDKGQIIITIRPLEGETFETVLHALNTLGDGCIDTYIAVTAIAIDKNGTAEHIRTPFRISPDDILAVCQKQKSHGSYTPAQRAEVIKHLKTLSQGRVIATMPGRPRRGKDAGTIIKAEGALIDLLSFKIGEYHLITGEEIWEQRSIAIGEWATMIPELSHQTATMLRQVLAYSAKNDRYQKRLGVYLTLMFRINASRNRGRFPNDISMRALLEGAGIVPDKKRPGRFRDSIEQALKDLKRDGVIGNYWQVIDQTPKGQASRQLIQEQAYGWRDLWLEQMWNFDPAPNILKQYEGLLSGPEED